MGGVFEGKVSWVGRVDSWLFLDAKVHMFFRLIQAHFSGLRVSKILRRRSRYFA